MIEPGIIISIATIVVGSVVWAVRIEGKVNNHDSLFIEREKLSESRHEAVVARLVRIESKVDKNGNGHA